MSALEDPVLETLFLPFRDGVLGLPEDAKALWLRARAGFAVNDLPHDRLACVQSFKPAHDRLAEAGFNVTSDMPEASYGMSLVLPPRQREESRALLARAVRVTREGGFVVGCVSNLEGAKTVENDLKALTGAVSSLSKHKCRVFWARVQADKLDVSLADHWLAEDAPREVEGGFVSRPGVFAWDRIDAGSKLLMQHVPGGLTGRGADFGAGFGYLSHEALSRYSAITRIDLYEAEARAIELARRNLAGFGERAGFVWADVLAGTGEGYDFILSNPPFHIDRADRHDLGRGFITAASKALRTGGELWMVANRHLPYEDALKAAFRHVKPVADDGAYKIFRAVR